MQEDRIAINIELADDVIESVQILSRRNLRACRIFHDRTAGQVLECLPLIYHVCGKAHTLAAQHALARAAGMEPAMTGLALLPMLVETCREHARRILLDWPAMCGAEPDNAAMLRIQNKLHEIQTALRTDNIGGLQKALLQLQLALRQDIYGAIHITTNGWTSVAELLDWCRQSTHRAASLPHYVIQHGMQAFAQCDVLTLTLQDIDDPFVETMLEQDKDGGFVSRPHWQAQTYETGPLARMRDQPLLQAVQAEYGNGLLTRLTASLLELLQLPRAMQALLDNRGIERFIRVGKCEPRGAATVMVEAARGCLWHRVEMQNNKVRRYQILAPTEWNLHPEGALVQGLRGTKVDDAAGLTDQITLIFMAMDPCVACDITVSSYGCV